VGVRLLEVEWISNFTRSCSP